MLDKPSMDYSSVAEKSCGIPTLSQLSAACKVVETNGAVLECHEASSPNLMTAIINVDGCATKLPVRKAHCQVRRRWWRLRMNTAKTVRWYKRNMIKTTTVVCGHMLL